MIMEPACLTMSVFTPIRVKMPLLEAMAEMEAMEEMLVGGLIRTTTIPADRAEAADMEEMEATSERVTPTLTRELLMLSTPTLPASDAKNFGTEVFLRPSRFSAQTPTEARRDIFLLPSGRRLKILETLSVCARDDEKI